MLGVYLALGVLAGSAAFAQAVYSKYPTASKTAKKPLRVSELMCLEYSKSVVRIVTHVNTKSNTGIDECGISRPGESLIPEHNIILHARLKEFPHVVQIGFGRKTNISWLSGGSLISEQWVLTAAHIKQQPTMGPSAWARLGELDIDDDQDGAHPEILRIVDRKFHPKYRDVSNDIALFKLEKPVEFSPFIRPTCLHTEEASKAGPLLFTGWGSTEYGGPRASRLKRVEMKLVDSDTCSESYQHLRQLPNGIDGSQLCAKGDYGGTCEGDSGAPLQYKLTSLSCMWSQVGVSSFGQRCDARRRVPDVFTRVSFYIDWIESIVWPNATNGL